jgi:hypothetical protein
VSGWDGDVRIADMVVDIGADEVSCEDTSHELDWNADGIVNMSEFYDFSVAWLTHDPNDPQMPSGIDPNDFVHWNSRCDLDEDYDVDLSDLVILAEDNPQNWLWVACWRENFQQMQMSMMASTSILQQESVILSNVSISSESKLEAPSRPIQQQAAELRDTVLYLERLWLEDDSIRREINSTEWQQFMKEVYQSLIEIENPGHEFFTKEIER